MDEARTFTQNRFGVHLRFKFGVDQLIFSWRDFSGEREFAVNYEAIDVNNPASLTTNSSRYARNLFIIPLFVWISGIVATNVNRELSGGLLGVALVLAVGIYAARWSGLFANKFTLLSMAPAPTSAGGHALRIIKDKSHDAILEELRSRWRARFKRLYGTVNLSNDRDKETAKFGWLKDNGVITEAEHREALAALHFSEADEPSELLRRLN